MTQEENKVGWKAGAMVFVSAVFILYLIGVIWFDAYTDLRIAKQADSKLNELMDRSDAHRTLLTAFSNCRTGLVKDSREECAVKMRDYADIENLSEEFELVYSELKSEYLAEY